MAKTYAIALVLVSVSGGCSSVAPPPNIPAPVPNVVSLDPQWWYIFYSDGLPPQPSPDSPEAWSFEIPNSAGNGHVGYVQTPFNATTTLHSVTVTFKVESDSPQYEVRDPGDILPATVHLFFEQQGDDLFNPDGRWWADAGGYNLGSQDGQTIAVAVPLTPDQWTNVDGQHDPGAFSAAFANVGWIGLTFGGQYFWGHGVALGSGTAKFILIDFQVN